LAVFSIKSKNQLGYQLSVTGNIPCLILAMWSWGCELFLLFVAEDGSNWSQTSTFAKLWVL